MTLERLEEKKISILHKITTKKDLIKKKVVSTTKAQEYLLNVYGIENLTKEELPNYRDWYAWADISTSFYHIEGNKEAIKKLEEEISEYESDLSYVGKQIDNFNKLLIGDIKLPEVLIELKENLSENDEFDVDSKDGLLYTIGDIYFRVLEAVGDNPDWTNVVCVGTSMNGIVTGKASSIMVTSVLAGGYGVQKRHLRTVIKQTKQEESYEEE